MDSTAYLDLGLLQTESALKCESALKSAARPLQRYELTEDDRLFYLHIPKTAGTTFTRHCMLTSRLNESVHPLQAGS
jgi:hypothetical protein